MNRKAVIDIGSNSVLLLVAEFLDDHWRPVFETSTVTALGEGTKESGLLSAAAMDRTLAALGRGFADAKLHGADAVIAAATMAARIASNTTEFQKLASAQGTPIRVLSGEDEAKLGFLSVASDPVFARENRLAIIDPGGQSTELVVAYRTGDGWTTCFEKSFPVGTLGLRGTLLPGETPDAMAIRHATLHLDTVLNVPEMPNDTGTAVVLGATGTNLITIREHMTDWDSNRVHGQSLSLEEIRAGVEAMMKMTDSERAAIVGIEPGRERTIHIGSLILDRFMVRIHKDVVRVSTRGWRFALLEREFGLNC